MENNENEIEILDFDSTSVKDEEKKEKSKKNKKKIISKKSKVIQNIFLIVSLLFIIGCFIFYGCRLVKYYRIYNPKTESGEKVELISNLIMKSSSIVYEGDGLYKEGEINIYKGDAKNYISFSNLTWRIISINNDGSINIILDNPINILKWDSNKHEYINSDIYNYLNNKFLKYLNNDLLAKTTICLDNVKSSSDISCNKTSSDNYVRLLNINEYINSKTTENKTYLDSDYPFWLNTTNDKKVWIGNKSNLSLADISEMYAIRPVVTIKNSTPLYSGKGTKENPYTIEKTKKNSIKIGSFIELGKDKWVVYDINDEKISLALDKSSLNYRFDLKDNIYNTSNEYSIAKYLNTTYLNTLSYKSLILDNEWSVGTYKNSYQDVDKNTVKSKIGMLNIEDLKIGENIKNYYLLNGSNNGQAYIYSDTLIESKVTMARNIRPAIVINISEVISGNGTEENPFLIAEE